MTQMRREPAALRSGVKHSTIEPPRSQNRLYSAKGDDIYISQIHLDVINVKCVATMNISVADKRYASTAVCLNIANLVSVKHMPSVSTAQVIILLTQKNATMGERETNH